MDVDSLLLAVAGQERTCDLGTLKPLEKLKKAVQWELRMNYLKQSGAT
jgi:hypothetical protein